MFELIYILLIQSGYNFEHVTTAKLWWHVQNYDLIGSSFLRKSYIHFYDILVMSSDIFCEMGSKPW